MFADIDPLALPPVPSRPVPRLSVQSNPPPPPLPKKPDPTEHLRSHSLTLSTRKSRKARKSSMPELQQAEGDNLPSPSQPIDVDATEVTNTEEDLPTPLLDADTPTLETLKQLSSTPRQRSKSVDRGTRGRRSSTILPATTRRIEHAKRMEKRNSLFGGLIRVRRKSLDKHLDRGSGTTSTSGRSRSNSAASVGSTPGSGGGGIHRGGDEGAATAPPPNADDEGRDLASTMRTAPRRKSRSGGGGTLMHRRRKPLPKADAYSTVL